jgi:hypothetical protein
MVNGPDGEHVVSDFELGLTNTIGVYSHLNTYIKCLVSRHLHMTGGFTCLLVFRHLAMAGGFTGLFVTRHCTGQRFGKCLETN